MAAQGQIDYRQKENRAVRRDRRSCAALGLIEQGGPPGSTPAERPELFEGISPGDCRSIYASARTRVFARGEMLYLEGYPVEQIFLLTAGLVKITQLAPSGTETILRFGAPGDGLGMIALCTNGCHRSTARAFRSCRTLAWDALEFAAIVERFPVLWTNILRILGEDLAELEVRFREVATERVGPRVARQLFRLLHQMGQPVGGAIEIALSRQDLAETTGTTLFTVSRLLSEWEERGFVSPGREAVTICDPQSLCTIFEES